MLGLIADVLFVLVAGGAAWLVARHGTVRAATCLVALLISAVFALTNFEVVSKWVTRVYLTGASIRFDRYIYFPTLLALFAAALLVLLYLSRKALPEPPEFSDRFETAGKWGLGLACGYVLAAFLLTAVHTASVPRDFWGLLEPQADLRDGPVTHFAPDYHMLGVVEFAGDRAFAIDSESWAAEAPLIEITGSGGRWPSFIARYAVWREMKEEQDREAAEEPDEDSGGNTSE